MKCELPNAFLRGGGGRGVGGGGGLVGPLGLCALSALP